MVKRKPSDRARTQTPTSADTPKNGEVSEPSLLETVKEWLSFGLSGLLIFVFLGGFFVDRYRKRAIATDLVHSLCQGKKVAGPELTAHMTQRNYNEFIDYPWPCDTKVRLVSMRPPYEPSWADRITMDVLEPSDGAHIAYLQFDGMFVIQKLRLKKIWIKENREDPFP